MFLFISGYSSFPSSPCHSNTSYVLIYQERAWLQWLWISFKYILCSYLSYFVFLHLPVGFIQIHPMFLFIVNLIAERRGVFLIQIHPMFLFIIINSGSVRSMFLFKYILCSYLSIRAYLFTSLWRSFKYILCSYLSTAFTPFRNTIIFLNPLFYKSPAIFPRR